MPRGWKRSWIKMWVNECIDGSIREDLEADERGVWYDLIIYSAKCRVPGVISANETEPISRRRLAGILNITDELLDRTIKKCERAGRIKADKKGLLTIANWNKYQSESDRVQAYGQRRRGIPPERDDEKLEQGWKPDGMGNWYKPTEFQKQSNELVKRATKQMVD